MSFGKHFVSFIKDIFYFAWQNKAWWIIPVVLVFIAIATLIFVGQTSAPFIYTLF
jgi:hypothetical protein